MTVLLQQRKIVIVWILENDIGKETVGTGVLDGPKNQTNFHNQSANRKDVVSRKPSPVGKVAAKPTDEENGIERNKRRTENHKF
ncbi:MAG: hypothetical protein IKA44_03375 [Clostridia bacterium]|nr:hypothetical protein [Clostridia bacterium]